MQTRGTIRNEPSVASPSIDPSAHHRSSVAGALTIPFVFEPPSMGYQFGLAKTSLCAGKMIGITPVLSMLGFMADCSDDPPIKLIWSNRSREHVVVAEGIAVLAAHSFIRLSRNRTGDFI